jgi:hypothetical protein
VLVLCF